MNHYGLLTNWSRWRANSDRTPLCPQNFRPPSHPWSPAKITTSFFLLLLVSMLISLLPNTIWLTMNVKCGPFKGYEAPLDVVSAFMQEGGKNPDYSVLQLDSINSLFTWLLSPIFLMIFGGVM